MRPPLCLRCDGPMKIKTITPTIFTATIDEVVFRCSDCEIETTKMYRQATATEYRQVTATEA
jgi:hypothetical protein